MSATSDEASLAQRAADAMYAADQASQALGMRITAIDVGSAALAMEVTDSMVNGLGVCHGGIVFALADSAMAFASNSHNDMSFAASADMTWLLPAHRGDTLTAAAAEQARVGRTGVYDVVVQNQDGATVALFRGRVRSTGRPLLDDQDAVGDRPMARGSR